MIEQSNLLLTNASSVSLEALVKGVPVIIIGYQTGITQNPIPVTIPQEYWKIVYTSSQCSEIIKYFHAMDTDAKRIMNESNETLKKRFFEPVTRPSVLKFLELQG